MALFDFGNEFAATGLFQPFGVVMLFHGVVRMIRPALFKNNVERIICFCQLS